MPTEAVNIPSADGRIDAWLHTPEGAAPGRR